MYVERMTSADAVGDSLRSVVWGRASWGVRYLAVLSLSVTALLGWPPVSATAASSGLPNTSTPSLKLNRTIRTTPFINTTSSMKDAEGSAFVPNNQADPNDDSLWLADDNGKSVWEVNPYSGALRSRIGPTEWATTKGFTTGALPTSSNYQDLESLAYDANTDTLYAFNGSCCSSSVVPTAFRLKRGGDGTFHPESWRSLPSNSDFTASAWNSKDAQLWVAKGSDLRTYTYATNAVGAITPISNGSSNLSGILGMSFSKDGSELYVAGKSTKLTRVNWTTKSVVPGWSFTLSAISGVKDSRAVELIPNTVSTSFDQFYVLDGYDGRSSGDPLKHAVFVFDVLCSDCDPVPPSASFSWSESSSANTIQFTDTSSGAPTSYNWDFGDGSTANVRSPAHTYSGPGSYGVSLTVDNSVGPPSTTTQTVVVTNRLTFPATADTYISWASPNTSYGTATIMKGAFSLNQKEYRPYLTFDVQLPQGATVTSATLRLYVTDKSPSGGEWYLMTSPWESGTDPLTWNNAHTIESEGTKFYTAGSATTVGQWLEIPTSVVTETDTYRFAAKFSSSDSVYFSSKEGSQPPQLVVTYSPSASA